MRKIIHSNYMIAEYFCLSLKMNDKTTLLIFKNDHCVLKINYIHKLQGCIQGCIVYTYES